MRQGIIIIFLWSLLLAPTLCGAGILAHFCAEDRGSQCGHEVDCSTDPCQVLAFGIVSKAGRGDHDFDLPDEMPVFLTAPTLDSVGSNLGPSVAPTTALTPPNDPANDRALPLLC